MRLALGPISKVHRMSVSTGFWLTIVIPALARNVLQHCGPSSFFGGTTLASAGFDGAAGGTSGSRLGGCHSIRLVGSPSSFFGELLWHAPVSMVLPVLAPYVELAAIRSEWAANAYIGSPSFAWRGVLIRVASH